MAILTKAQLEALNQSSFPNNSAEAITPEILRTYNTATIDTLVDSLDTGSFTTDSEFNALSSSVDTQLTNLTTSQSIDNTKWNNLGSQSGSWITESESGSFLITASFDNGTRNLTFTKGNTTQFSVNIPDVTGSVGNFATTGSNTFTGDQTIQSDGTLNGIFYKTGSSEFFVGQRSNGNFSISSSAESRIIDINPQSGWVEHYTQTNFNSNVATRATLDVRNVIQQTGSGYIAQFDNLTASLQEGYAWVGKNGGTSIAVPTASFAGAAPVGTATTGSNTFTGQQIIESTLTIARPDNPLILTNISQDAVTDKLSFSQSGGNGFAFNDSIFVDGGNKLYIQRDTTGAQQYLRLGATDNTYNFAFIVTGSDTTPGQQVWGINTAGGIWANSFDAGVVFNSYVTASNGIRIQDGGTFSAPLQQGYVWVGNASGRTSLIPTSSFGGGGSTFPYTGNAQITGSLGVSGAITGKGGLFITGGNVVVQDNNITTNRNLTVGQDTTIYGNVSASGEIRTDSRMYVFNQYGGIDIQQNPQGSGSQYPGMSMKVAPNTYPNDIFGGFTVLTELGAQVGATYLGMVANSYTPQYGGTTVPMILANGNNPDGNDTAIIWTPNGNAEHYKNSQFKYGLGITGSALVNGSSIVTSNQTGSLVNVPLTSLNSFTQSQQVLNAQYATTGSNSFNGTQTITGSLTQRNGNTSLAGNLNVSGAFVNINSPGGNGLSITGSGLYAQGTITSDNGVNSNGAVNILGGAGLTIQANLQGSGSAYSIAGAFVDNTTDPTNVYSAFQLVDAQSFATLALAYNSYTPYYSTSTAMIAGAGQYNGSDVIFGFPNNTIDVWKPAKFKAPATFTTGSNQQAGTATLNGANPGTVTVSNSLVTANSIIMLTKQDNAHDGYVVVSAKSNGSFTITSSGNGDTSVVGWFIINNS